jgi:hypothetical protein
MSRKHLPLFLAAGMVLATNSASAATWYLSPTGSDSNPGTEASPLATLMEAQTKASSGDTVSILEGTYEVPDAYNSIQDGVYAAVNYINKSGITYASEPTNTTRPVFNFSAINPTGYRVAAFWLPSGTSNVTFQGFDVVGVQENITTGNNQSIGMAVWGCTGCTWNEVNVHDADCVGFYLEEVSKSNLWYRCDSYNNTGINSYSYGNADGFGCHPAAGGKGNIIRECRSWNNSDDGYDCINTSETVVFDHCWSYNNGNNGGNGNGFKVGGWGCSGATMPATIPVHIVQFCLAADNHGNGGFYANHQPGQSAFWTNNTSYDNATDFNMLEGNGNESTNCSVDGTREVMHYNLAYQGTITQNFNETGAPVSSNSFTESGLTLSASDFVSTALTQMTNARFANGALPVITFMHLSSAGEVTLTNLGCFIVPPAPAGLTVTGGTGQLLLNWSASPGAYGYNVYRASTSGGTYTNIGLWLTGTSYTNTGLSNGTAFYYQVTAVNPGDESGNAGAVGGVTLPAAPAGLIATGGLEQVVLQWNASTGASSYNVLSAVGSGGPYFTNATGVTTTNYTNTGLASGATYYYKVAAFNASGASGNSAAVSAATVLPPPPTFNDPALSGASLTFSGAGGVTNGIYYVLESTNLTLDPAQWTRVATNPFDAGGNFIFTNTPPPGLDPLFYLIELP